MDNIQLETRIDRQTGKVEAGANFIVWLEDNGHDSASEKTRQARRQAYLNRLLRMLRGR